MKSVTENDFLTKLSSPSKCSRSRAKVVFHALKGNVKNNKIYLNLGTCSSLNARIALSNLLYYWAPFPQ